MKGLRGLAADEVGERRNDRLIWDGELAAEVVPESDAQLGAGLGQAKEGIPAVATDIAAGTAADFAFGDLAADIVLRGIGVQGDVRVVERGQWSGLIIDPIAGARSFVGVTSFANSKTLRTSAKVVPRASLNGTTKW